MLHHCNNSVFPGAKNLPENQAIFEYYDLMLQSISSYSFQAMAHLDFPRRYFDSWEIPEKTINSILELMIKKEILLEINTSSISNDCTEPLPSYNIIKKYIELGGKKVVLGSDAHNCSFLGNGYDCIRKNLPLELEIGYFKNRETEYAEIIYTTSDGTETIKHDSRNMDMFYHISPTEDYTLSVVYYDSEGNKYE